MIGFDTCDDAAVYRLSDEVAFISTVDFITPPVDDPYWFGQIAAANALSDIYAMGGRPLTALNLIMFPLKKLGRHLFKEILRGGYDKVIEAGASLAGGHSIDDREPKYGLAVTGIVHPARILTNCAIMAGDALILTKPLGTGVLFNACRDKLLPYTDLEMLLPSIAALNAKALETARTFDVHACTDVTGFGLIGHLLEMAQSGNAINLFYDALPVYPHALAMYREGVSTRNNRANKEQASGALTFDRRLSDAEEAILFDPQTSGGLIFSVPASQSDSLLRALKERGVKSAAVIGEVLAGDRPSIRII